MDNSKKNDGNHLTEKGFLGAGRNFNENKDISKIKIIEGKENLIGSGKIKNEQKINQEEILKEEEKFKPVNKIAGNIYAESENIGSIRSKKKFLKKKLKKKISLPIIILFLFMISALIVAVVYSLYNSKEIKIEKEIQPQDIIRMSVGKMKDVKTYSFDGQLGFDVVSMIESPDVPEDFSFVTRIVGKTDRNDIKNLKEYYDVKMEIGASEEKNISFDFEIIFIGEDEIYYKPKNYDLGVLGPLLELKIGPLRNRWYLMNIDELYGIDGFEYNINGYNNIYLTEDIYDKDHLLRFSKDLGDKKIDNNDVYHYKIDVDDKVVADFYMNAIREIEFKKSGDSFKDKYYKAIEKLKGNVDNYNDLIDESINNSHMEVWIGKDNLLLRKLKFGGEVNNDLIEKLAGEYGDSKILKNSFTVIDLDINFNNFNKKVYIEKPENYENYMDVMGGVARWLLPYGNIGAPIDSDDDGLIDILESFYGTEKNNSDTDGDGYTDGEEVENGYDPTMPGGAKLDYEKLFSA